MPIMNSDGRDAVNICDMQREGKYACVMYGDGGWGDDGRIDGI